MAELVFKDGALSTHQTRELLLSIVDTERWASGRRRAALAGASPSIEIWDVLLEIFRANIAGIWCSKADLIAATSLEEPCVRSALDRMHSLQFVEFRNEGKTTGGGKYRLTEQKFKDTFHVLMGMYEANHAHTSY